MNENIIKGNRFSLFQKIILDHMDYV